MRAAVNATRSRPPISAAPLAGRTIRAGGRVVAAVAGVRRDPPVARTGGPKPAVRTTIESRRERVSLACRDQAVWRPGRFSLVRPDIQLEIRPGSDIVEDRLWPSAAAFPPVVSQLREQPPVGERCTRCPPPILCCSPEVGVQPILIRNTYPIRSPTLRITKVTRWPSP